MLYKNLSLYIFLAYCMKLLLFAIAVGEEPETDTYPALLGDDSTVYDGDTIQDVYVIIKEFENQEFPAEVLWPGIFLKEDTLYAVTDIRIEGIDTPEKKPSTTYSDGSQRPEDERQAERDAAALAQKALFELLEGNDFEFDVVDPELGKYAGRIVASVYVGEGEERINVSDYMIEQGLAYPYFGDSKIDFIDWYDGE